MEEKQCVEANLKSFMENYDLPSLELCHEIITNNQALHNRSATQLKAFVNNHIVKEKQCLKQANPPKGNYTELH